MAIWIDRKLAAKQRRSPGVTPESEVQAMRVQSTNLSDLRRSGEKVVHNDELFDEKAIKNIKTRIKKQKAEVRAAKEKAKATDHSKEFGEESPGKKTDG